MRTPSFPEQIGGVAATEVSGNDEFDTAHRNYKQEINQEGHQTRLTLSSGKEARSNSSIIHRQDQRTLTHRHWQMQGRANHPNPSSYRRGCQYEGAAPAL